MTLGYKLAPLCGMWKQIDENSYESCELDAGHLGEHKVARELGDDHAKS